MSEKIAGLEGKLPALAGDRIVSYSIVDCAYDQVIQMVFGRSKRTGMAGMMERRAGQIERTGTEVSEMAAEKGAMASRRISDILRRAADDISTVAPEKYRTKIADTMSSARDTVDTSAETVKTNIREHPLSSVAMAVGVGFMMGAALSLIGSRVYRETAHESRY